MDPNTRKPFVIISHTIHDLTQAQTVALPKFEGVDHEL